MDVLKDIVPAMVLAPSAHNTQPWRFKPGRASVDVFVDMKRHLEVSDPTQRELYVSLGCAIFNGVVAAAKQGAVTTVTYFPDGEEDSMPAARLLFEAGEVEADLADLLDVIPRRRTDRSVYDAEALRDTERAVLVGKNENVFLVTKREKLERLAHLTGEGSYQTLSRPDFREELSHWVRSDWTRQPDGMPGYAMGVPAPMSLFITTLVKVLPLHKQEQANTAKQLSSASAAIVIATMGDTKRDWLEAGQLMERSWLAATKAGLAVGILAAAIESSRELRNSVQEILGTQRFPQVIMRIGHRKGRRPRPTSRRSVEDCLVR